MSNYLIGIAAHTYLDGGNVMVSSLVSDEDIQTFERRVSRTKTLDGGVSITDGGVSVGDRTLDISTFWTGDLWDILMSIFNISWVTVSTREAFFLTKFESLKVDKDKIAMRFMVKENLSIE